MKVTIRGFTGMRPVSGTDLLKPGEAASATDVLLTGGDLEPLKGLSQIKALTSANPIKTIYRYGQNNANEDQYWFQSDSEVHFVKGPFDGDTEERTFWTDGTYPKKTKANIATTGEPYPSNSYRMGIPRPAVFDVAVSGVADDPNSNPETVVYVVTYVSSWGEEGPPSAPTAAVSWRVGQQVDVTNLPVAPVGAYTIAGKRLYRSATGASGAAKYLLVNTGGDIPIATTTYTDTTLTADLGEALISRYWDPPEDTMRFLCVMANGLMAGAYGATVCFCEPGVPHAWPKRYRRPVDSEVTGICAFGQSILVATKRLLYVFTGVDPMNMTQQIFPQTCASSRSMVAMMDGVVFASPDGLMYANESGVRTLSDGLMSLREWRNYAPESMHAYEQDGRYICFYDADGPPAGMIFTFGSEPSMVLTSLSATAGFRDRTRDALYLCVNGGGTVRNIKKWDSGSSMTLSWTSGVFRLMSKVNLAWARVDATGSTTFELFADGLSKYGPVTVLSNTPFRLPHGYRSMRYQFRVSGTNTIRSVELATTAQELTSG